MSTLRIVDAPLLPNIDGTEKIPTGGRGDYAISVDQIKDHIFQDIGKELVGLGNVDNTSDLDKPVSTAQQAALNLKADKTYVDTNLDLKADKTNVYTRSETTLALSQKADLVNGVVPENQIPSSFNDVLEFTTPNLPLIGESGKIYVTTDTNKTWRWSGNKYVEISGWNPDSVSKVITLPTYYTIAAGVDPLTGVADGAYFNVRSTEDETVAIEYQNVGGSAVATGKRYPSGSYVETIAEYTALPFKVGKSYTLYERVQLANGDIVKSSVSGNTTDPNIDMTGWHLESDNVVNSPLDLLSIRNPKYAERAFVESLSAYYTYYPDTNQTNNDVTVVGKWVMDMQDAYYASWFATPNLQVDQKSKLRIGYACATLKQRPFIIDDIFWIGVTSVDHVGLNVLSNSKLSFKMGVGGLKLLPNNLDRYNMVRFYGCENFKVTHLSIEGDRLTHTGATGEWGHGLSVEDCKNGLIYMPKILNTWGDGIDFGRSTTDATLDYDPTDIIIYAPIIDRARRNGISLKSFNNVKIINPIIKKVGNYNGVNATSPRSGIDVEPNAGMLAGTRPQCIGGLITNPRIEDCTVGLIISNNQDRTFEITVSGTTYIKKCRVPLELYNNSELATGSAVVESVVIDGLYVGGATGDAATNAILNLGWNGAGLLSVNVNSLKICKNIPKVDINKILPSVDYTSLNFGNIFIRNIDFEQGSTVAYNLSAKDAIYTDNIVLSRSDKCRGLITINATGYNTAAAAGKKGANYFVDGYRTLATGDSSISVRYPSKIVINGGALSSNFTLNTDNDFSTRTVEYSPSSTSTTYNLVVSNLNLTIDGQTKLGAVTNQRGARITYRKTDGPTEIVELLGNWTFI